MSSRAERVGKFTSFEYILLKEIWWLFDETFDCLRCRSAATVCGVGLRRVLRSVDDAVRHVGSSVYLHGRLHAGARHRLFQMQQWVYRSYCFVEIYCVSNPSSGGRFKITISNQKFTFKHTFKKWKKVYDITQQSLWGEGKGKRGFVWRLVVNTPLRRSGMAHVLKRSHSFTCTPRIHPLIMRSRSRSWSSFTDHGGMEGWVGLGLALAAFRVNQKSASPRET